MMDSFKPLQVDSSLPLYEQLMHYLRTAILTGEYPRGTKLPPELKLCKLFSISRITARRAIAELVNEGLLERRQGKGTYVAYQKVNIHVMSLDAFSGLSAIREVGVSVRILGKMQRNATNKEARLLHLATGAPIYELTRQFELNEVPLCLERAVYDANRYPDLLNKIDENTAPHEILATDYGTENARAVKEIEISPARPEEADSLQCKVGEMLYLVTEVVYDAMNHPNYFTINLIRTEQIKLTMTYTAERL